MNRKKHLKRIVLISLLLFLVIAVSASVGSAQEGKGLTAVPNATTEESTFAGAAEKVAAPGIAAHSLESVSIIVTFDDTVDTAALEAASGGEVVYRFEKVFNGASMLLAGENVEAIAALGGVTGIYLDELHQIDTEVSPVFIGAPTIWNMLGGQESAGEGVTVGVLDTGVWPEHPSFSDPDPFGNAYDPPPVAPGANGFGASGPRSTCNFGNVAHNPNDAPFTCNNKLIGAYDFTDTYKALLGILPAEFDSARDANGHGTHTMSTAAGNGSVAASIFGVPRGNVSGIAPRAHVIMYKVCLNQGCFSSDSAAAVEQAILDEVDTINFSISGGNSPYTDIVSLAFLAAYDNGVFVAASAGNSGPGANTVAHREPWTTTVAASTSDRHFLSTVSLTADNGDTLTMIGSSVTDGISTPTSVIFPPAGQELCLTPFAAGTFNGEIVICRRGVNARVAKSYNVSVGGAGGMLLYNPALQGLQTDNHFVPSVQLEVNDGNALLNFMATHTGEMATFTAGMATAVPGDVMAAFSSRGGSGQTLGISKPDITAPGVQVLAGHTPMPATVEGGLPGQLFQAIAGTSMSSPHVAGSAALMKALHPDWTPGQIKSALMMTANENVVKEDGITPATPFDDGSGRVDLNVAGNPAATISASAQEFIDHQNDLWNANYPSLYVPVMSGKITVQRTLHNELSRTNVWRTSVDSPADVTVTVPRTIVLTAGGDSTFNITVDARHVPLGQVRHATLYLTDKVTHTTLHFPITIVRTQANVTLTKSCTPDVAVQGSEIDCTITITNTTFDDATVHLDDRLPAGLPLDKFSLVGASHQGNWRVYFDGTLAGAEPPQVGVAVDPAAAPYGYFGLGPLPGNVIVPATDESITNYNVPAFTYAGQTYTRIGIVSNGYVVVGGGTGGDVSFVNSDLPNASPPNNVLAPFWTDLNPGAGGRVLVNVLSDGADSWIVVEYESVPNFGDGETNTAQIWIGLNTDANPGEDVFFTYGTDISDGDGGLLTVGAENSFGNSGGTTYFNGAGTPPASTNDTGHAVDVFSAPGVPGETHVITFSMFANRLGPWTNCAELSSNLFQGLNIACDSGEVVP
jgi:hypothetical protein